MSTPPFRLIRPPHPASPLIASSPHSGRTYPADFVARTVLDERVIRSSEDAFVDILLERAPDLGVPLIAAEMPRAYVDLNRSERELDPALVQGVAKAGINPRVNSGLGVIPRVVAQGRAIYRGKITRAEAEARLEDVWRPYHGALVDLMEQACAAFGRAVLLDVHSMPHEAIEGAAPKGRTPEIVLGDRFGASADSGLVDAVEGIFRGLGFRVARNAPFAGAFIAQAYGKPEQGRHVLQIEIDRALYMDERRLARSADFDAVRNLMTEALMRIRDVTLQDGQQVAAE
ncbi:N-formylglutamate amidohydrolase [Jannaschia aquimarina]|uniref:N-formylglutamate amidohydrolase n=1 Tax=Jannaschia aquimarina TaxID=935700 RepID=A0A0D1EHS8_9RHOB|nr:N-formylglutamate amidohydrolase [Jannaschia aquimarina]KIT15380.1 N-formylglutamate amidohydrolase [Jannaschia aquimarina]SNT23143.1 N-formylglutamate amidohydrolase [Jannaschia aquimarina]